MCYDGIRQRQEHGTFGHRGIRCQHWSYLGSKKCKVFSFGTTEGFNERKEIGCRKTLQSKKVGNLWFSTIKPSKILLNIFLLQTNVTYIKCPRELFLGKHFFETSMPSLSFFILHTQEHGCSRNKVKSFSWPVYSEIVTWLVLSGLVSDRLEFKRYVEVVT